MMTLSIRHREFLKVEINSQVQHLLGLKPHIEDYTKKIEKKHRFFHIYKYSVLVLSKKTEEAYICLSELYLFVVIIFCFVDLLVIRSGLLLIDLQAENWLDLVIKSVTNEVPIRTFDKSSATRDDTLLLGTKKYSYYCLVGLTYIYERFDRICVI